MRIFLCFAAWLLMATAAYAEHPAAEYDPRFDPGYNSYVGDSAWNQGELKFFKHDQRIPYDSLSPMERYMACGAYDGNGDVMFPFWLRIAGIGNEYYTHYGVLPEFLDADAIRSLPGRDHMTDEQLDWFRSPVSGEWIQPGNPAQIPGNIFLHPLSTAEKVYLSQFVEDYKRSWFHELEFSKELYDQGYDWYDCFTKVEPISSEIWYFRMYGENGVLMAGTTYGRSH